MKCVVYGGLGRKVCRSAICIAGAIMLTACGSPPEPTELSGGVWLLENTTRTRDGVLIPCRPMLMPVIISDNRVFLGTRLYPCENEKQSAQVLLLQREGTKLFLDERDVGTLAARRMDIAWAPGESISWNLDRPDAPWQELRNENGTPVLYQAQLSHRDDSTPVPMPAEFSGSEDTSVSGQLHAATLATDVDRVRFMIDTKVQHGHLWTFDPEDGAFDYAPFFDFAGRDEFTFFSVLSGSAGTRSETAPVGITLSNVPDAPVAHDVLFSLNEDETASITPTVEEPDGQPWTLEIFKMPQHGSVTVNGTTLTYSPEANFSGSDSFSYRAYDGAQWSNTAKLMAQVMPVNDPPTVKDLDVVVTSGCPAPLNLQASDPDSKQLSVQSHTTPNLGTLRGSFPNFVYEPNPFGTQGQEYMVFFIEDDAGAWAKAIVRVTISPGAHRCTLLRDIAAIEEVYPEASLNSYIYFRPAPQPAPATIGFTDGTPMLTNPQWLSASGSFGFDNAVGNTHRSTFFKVQSTGYFTTSTTSWGLRLYQVPGFIGNLTVETIPKPGNEVSGEPSVGEAYVDGDSAYFPVQWPTGAADNICQIWKTNSVTLTTEPVRTIPSVQGQCLGIWSFAGNQYMFVGSKLVRTPLDSSPLVIIKDLGDALPSRWMVEAGGKLFFQTRTTVGIETRIDLWVTDGTESGTKVLKTLETSILEFNIFSPVAFANKLFFAHRKSLWSSDGTDAGTSIVKTMDVSTVVGDGVIGTITPTLDKLYFLASTDVAGREPWTSDGTVAGTKMLRDIRAGASGSATASTNPVYFHVWNDKIFFTADAGGGQAGLWTTDGTPDGTVPFQVCSMRTILGILGNNLVFFDGHYMYSMDML